MSKLLRAFVLCVTGAALSAQTTWQVGGSAVLPDIDAAMAVCAPGDILEVADGYYPPFTATKGVIIRSQGLATVLGTFFGGAPVVCDIPAGQELHLKRMMFNTAKVEVVGGRVSMAHCQVSAVSGQSAVTVNGASVHLIGCTLAGGSVPALHAIASDVTAVACWFRRTSGGAGLKGNVYLDNSRFHASDVVMPRGVWPGPGHAVTAIHGSSAWISDSVIEAHSCAFDRVASTVRIDRCSVLENGVGCASGVPGTLLGVDALSAQTFGAGVTWQPEFRFEPNSFVVLFASPRLDSVSWGPLIEQPTWLNHSLSFSAQVLFTDSSGSAQASIAIPSGPSITDQRLWFVGIAGPGLPLQSTPVIGGVL